MSGSQGTVYRCNWEAKGQFTVAIVPHRLAEKYGAGVWRQEGAGEKEGAGATVRLQRSSFVPSFRAPTFCAGLSSVWFCLSVSDRRSALAGLLCDGTPSACPRREQHPANGLAVPRRSSGEWIVPDRESRRAETACRAPATSHRPWPGPAIQGLVLIVPRSSPPTLVSIPVDNPSTLRTPKPSRHSRTPAFGRSTYSKRANPILASSCPDCPRPSPLVADRSPSPQGVFADPYLPLSALARPACGHHSRAEPAQGWPSGNQSTSALDGE